LQATIDEMPDLERVELGGIYRRGGHGLRHPKATFVIPPPTPWLPRDPTADPVTRFVSVGTRQILVDLRELVVAMERVYVTLPVETRAFWDDFWEAMATETLEVSGRELAAALDACGAALADEAWRDVAAALRDREDLTTIGR
jgi:hypothetical protein